MRAGVRRLWHVCKEFCANLSQLFLLATISFTSKGVWESSNIPGTVLVLLSNRPEDYWEWLWRGRWVFLLAWQFIYVKEVVQEWFLWGLWRTSYLRGEGRWCHFLWSPSYVQFPSSQRWPSLLSPRPPQARVPLQNIDSNMQLSDLGPRSQPVQTEERHIHI